METPDASQAEAILEEGHAAIRGLVDRLTSAQLEYPATIGGGDWSARDLVGHLTSWEAHALEALEAWREGRTAPVLRDLRTIGLTAVNARTAEADRRRTTAEVVARSDEIHRRLIEAIAGLSVEAWLAPPTRRSRRATGAILGSILGGPGGLFRHAWAHLPDLERYTTGSSAMPDARTSRSSSQPAR